MSDRSPRLSDESDVDATETLSDTALGQALREAGFGPSPDEARHVAEPDVADERRAAVDEPSAESNTAVIAERAAIYGATPGPGEPDPRAVWLFSSQDFADGRRAAAEIAPRAFQSVAEAFALIAETITPDGYRMADEREGLIWGLVNVLHSHTTRMQKQLDEIAERIEFAKREYAETVREKGADTASYELEQLTDRYIAAGGKRDVFERFRDFAANIYFDETGKVWQPRAGTHASQTASLATRVDSRDFLRARAALGDRRDVPEGTLIAVTGYRDGPDHRTIYRTLDAVRAKYPDMILLHGGARGVQQIAAGWAANRGVVHVAFRPDYEAHGKAAIPRRDEEILKTDPKGVIAFLAPGSKPTFLHRESIRRGHNPLVVTGAAARLDASHRTVTVAADASETASIDPEARADRQARAFLRPRQGFLPDDHPLFPNRADDLRHPDAPELFARMEQANGSLLSLVDAIAPEHGTDPDRRRDLMSRVIGAVNDHLASPGGLNDRADRLAGGIRYLAPAEGPSEVVDMQLRDAVDASHDITGTIDRVEHIRASLAEVYREETGEQWRPAASFSPRPDPTITGASAEATRAVEARREKQHLAHDLEGTPIAVTGGKDGPARDVVFATMDRILDKYPDAVLLHGNAPGIQQIVGEWATERNRPQITYQPDRRGRSQSTAIVRRDKAILDANPVGVVDFSPPDEPTALSAMARKRGFRVLEVSELLRARGRSQSSPPDMAPDAATQRRGAGFSL